MDTEISDNNVYHLNDLAFSTFKNPGNKLSVLHFPIKVFGNKAQEVAGKTSTIEYSMALEKQLVNKYNNIETTMDGQDANP